MSKRPLKLDGVGRTLGFGVSLFWVSECEFPLVVEPHLLNGNSETHLVCPCGFPLEAIGNKIDCLELY